MFRKDNLKFNMPASGDWYGIGSDGTIYRGLCPDGADGINYQAPQGPLFTEEGRAELGITTHADPVRGDDRFFWINELPNGELEHIPKDLPGLRLVAIEEVKRQRQSALDTFPKSSGVSSVYDENLKAAQAHTAGDGATAIMRDGTTADQYLGHMAAGMGVTAAQFAAYVINENQAAATKAREIEAEYVRLVYSYIPACDFDQVQTAVAEFAEYCRERTTSQAAA